MWKAEILISGILSYFNITLQNMCYTLNLQMELILRNNSARRFRTDESPLPFNWSLRSGRPVTLFRTPPPRRGVCCLHRRKPDYTGGSSSLPPHCSCAQLYLPRTKREQERILLSSSLLRRQRGHFPMRPDSFSPVPNPGWAWTSLPIQTPVGPWVLQNHTNSSVSN